MSNFTLEDALQGKPVRLRNGNKAYIIGVHPKEVQTSYKLVGYFFYDDGSAIAETWTLNGRRSTGIVDHALDIIGPWEEPKRVINGVEVSKPLTLAEIRDGEYYYYVGFCNSNEMGNVICNRMFKEIERDAKLVNLGLVFDTKEKAEQMAKALLNYKVEEI